MSQSTRKEILKKLRRHYQKAGLAYKGQLLDQVQELLGYHRKAAIRALRAPEVEPAPRIITGCPLSNEPELLLRWLRPLWVAPDFACGRRLVEMLPDWIPAYEAYARRLPGEVCEKLLSASARTLDRLLAPARAQAKAARSPGPAPSCASESPSAAACGMKTCPVTWKPTPSPCVRAVWRAIL